MNEKGSSKYGELNDEQIEEAVALRRANFSLKEIGEVFNLSGGAMGQLFRGETYGGKGLVK